MEHMVLSEFFPSSGIDGVEEESVYGDDRDTLRDALQVGFDEEVLFRRIQVARGRAADWFLPGDVVCQRIGLHEERYDVLREISDKMYAPGGLSSSVEAHLEALRREAIETHAWKVHRSDDWCSVIDPQGRALVVAYTGAFRLWRKVMEQLVPRMGKSKTANTPAYRVSAAWCALRAAHRRFIHETDGDITRRDLSAADYMTKEIYEHRLKMGRFTGSGRIIRMRKYRGALHLPVWRRCFDMIEAGERVPFAVRHVYEHPSTKWVAVSVDDAEWLLGCSWWPEWKKHGPVRFEKFGKKGSASAQLWK